MNLVIVESPTKAKTLSKFLGSNYTVLASYGHVADLPKSGLGVDVENNFDPQYEVTKNGVKSLLAIKKASKQAEAVYLASDPDREGEAISYSILKRIKEYNKKLSKSIYRVSFHEITKDAVGESFKKPDQINMDLVYAQQARRILDRLVGYKLSPLLWKKIRYGLSAGRVQSVAVRLIVERQEKIDGFKPQEFWKVAAIFNHKQGALYAQLDISSLKPAKIKSEGVASKVVSEIKLIKDWRISNVEEKIHQRHPYPPFKTSTLQQAASVRFGWGAKKTVDTAQKLYEQGLITYMRTDSLNLSPAFLKEAEKLLKKHNLNLEKPKFYKNKSKSAQEAHEAIRPTNPTKSAKMLNLEGDLAKLYNIIWERSISSQAKSAVIRQKTILIKGGGFTFRVTGSEVEYPGWLLVRDGTISKALPKKQVSDDGGEVVNDIPSGIEKGDTVTLTEITPSQHFTEPPPYYNEASLVKELEKLEIGRPSTYASIIQTIISRSYVQKEGQKLVPTDSAKVVTKLLKKHFSNIVDYEFTAHMEKDLDRVAGGDLSWVALLADFYKPFVKEIEAKDKLIKKEDVVVFEELSRNCPECGLPLQLKLGKYGRFVSCSGFPSCKYAETSEAQKDKNLDEEQIKDPCPKCKGKLEFKEGPFGSFIACSNYPKCRFTKPYLDKVGVKCPKCSTGEIIKKVGKFRRIFYGCTNYPKCDFVSNKVPVDKK